MNPAQEPFLIAEVAVDATDETIRTLVRMLGPGSRGGPAQALHLQRRRHRPRRPQPVGVAGVRRPLRPAGGLGVRVVPRPLDAPPPGQPEHLQAGFGALEIWQASRRRFGAGRPDAGRTGRGEGRHRAGRRGRGGDVAVGRLRSTADSRRPGRTPPDLTPGGASAARTPPLGRPAATRTRKAPMPGAQAAHHPADSGTAAGLWRTSAASASRAAKMIRPVMPTRVDLRMLTVLTRPRRRPGW